MNNLELHEKAQELADTKTAYSLARELVLLGETAEMMRGESLIISILDGIDRCDSDGGWWETSAGAEFGDKKMREVLRAVNKIKADAIREAIKMTNVGDDFGNFSCSVYALEDYANKLEKGEL